MDDTLIMHFVFVAVNAMLSSLQAQQNNSASCYVLLFLAAVIYYQKETISLLY
jgi:hypothetical protein